MEIKQKAALNLSGFLCFAWRVVATNKTDIYLGSLRREIDISCEISPAVIEYAFQLRRGSK